MLTSTLSKESPFIDIQDGITLAQAIVDTVRDPLVVLDHDLRVVAASRSFYKTFRLVLTMCVAVEREFPTIGHRVMLLNARKVFYEKGAHSTVLLAFEDVTDRRAIEHQVQELLREKDMLSEEIEHRVTNSLQIIASILILKARSVQSEETRLQLEDAHQRVLSIAAVQQHLHVTGGGKPGAIDDRRQPADFAQGRCRCRHRDLARCREHRADRHRIGDECAETRLTICDK